MYHPKLLELTQRDRRYSYEAYDFVFHALAHTQKMLGRQPADERERDPDVVVSHHVTGPELLEGIRDLSLREFGLLARTVFRLWGIDSTTDFGQIVFNLIEANLLSKTTEDCLDDFRDIYNLDEALVNDFRINLDEES